MTISSPVFCLFVVFILICLCLGAPFASPASLACELPFAFHFISNANAKEAKVELRKRALAFAWLQLQRKRAKPGQKGKSSFRSYFDFPRL
jgi:hypothetical protein